MKKLIWKIRYAAHMRKRALMPVAYCWAAAGIALDEYPENIEDDPRWCCDDELSYWTE
jgi:hypothetical protein